MNRDQNLSANKILLVDDDQTLLTLLAEYLEAAGYQSITMPSGVAGLHAFDQYHPDFVILDVMMPGMDGWEVCERLRAKSAVPIIFLTAKGEEIDKLRGFHLGVDDYVTKPFSFAELTARISAIMVRARGMSSPTHQTISGDLTIDFNQHRVTVSNRAVELTPIEYRLLETLAHHANRTIPTETLLLDVWGPQYAGEIEHVKHFIWTLRKKIEVDPGDPKHLITERGFGYRFE
jgi:two-component system KDP operon response regulator KdpE